MGKSLKNKLRAREAQEQTVQQRLVAHSVARAQPSVEQPLEKEFEGYIAAAIRPATTFVRRTRSDHRSKQVLEMARHLFGRFRVPRVLEQAWAAYVPDTTVRFSGNVRTPTNVNVQHIDFRAWFVCVATGGSLFKTHTKGIMSKKETHVFLKAPSSLSLAQALVYAVAKCASANEGDALRLARSKIAEKRLDAFWFDAVRFFCLPGNTPQNVAQINDLLDYVDHRHRTEAHFRLLGSAQSLAALCRRMEEWHRALSRAKDLSGAKWEGIDVPDHTIVRTAAHAHQPDIQWTFHQITNGKELAAEGTAMRHCVLSYKPRCMQGMCSIWSLTKTDEYGTVSRRLTIELSAQGIIVQKRGLANRLPRPDEESVVQQWAKEMGWGNNHQRW